MPPLKNARTTKRKTAKSKTMLRRDTAADLSAQPLAGLPPLHWHAAGIDIGSTRHWVAVPADRDVQAVRSFGAFTEDLHALANWLEACGIRTVAMESTGVYWMPLYQLLEERGLEVVLVNARHARNVPGRSKTDVQDCQWLQKLHTFGLLASSFVPPAQVAVLRTYMRQLDETVVASTRTIQHMQKALLEMNLHLSHVVSDLTGETGMLIIHAILQGERDPSALARLRHGRIKASEAEIRKSLQGNWRPELLFKLGQAVEAYEFYQRQMGACRTRIAEQLATFTTRAAQPATFATQSRDPSSLLAQELHRISGTDLTRIDGVGTQTAATIIAEVGLDMTRWKTEKHFASWLGLCPDNRISGGKILKRATRHVVNRASDALRLAAQSLSRSKSALGAKYRRLRGRLGAPKAITAMAHQLARLVYRMLRYGQEYVDQGIDQYEARFRAQRVRWLQQQAKDLNMQVLAA